MEEHFTHNRAKKAETSKLNIKIVCNLYVIKKELLLMSNTKMNKVPGRPNYLSISNWQWEDDFRQMENITSEDSEVLL